MIQSRIGKGSTTDSQLTDIGKSLFKSKYHGTYPSDKLPKLTKRKPYTIINLDTSNKPGSHWISLVYNGKTLDGYDSFGRPIKSIIDHVPKSKILNSELDPEQHIIESNCGQRCIAWIYMYDQFGRKVAMQI